MANPWLLYQRSPSFVLGFHGSDKATVDAVVGGIAGHLDKSAGRYEWLGHGIYFWENDPQRGLEWAQTGHSRKNSVRAPFPEDELLYEGAGFRWRNHIQIAVINIECIKGYFRPLKV